MHSSPRPRGVRSLGVSTAFFLTLVLLACGGTGQESIAAPADAAGGDTALETDAQKVIYALGVGMAQQVGMFHLTEDEQKLMMAGLADALRGEAKVEMQAYQQQIQTLAQERFAAAAQEEAKLSATFVDHMASQPGAERLESGMVMTEMTAGTGDSPTATSNVKVHYHGTLRSGKVFDSSVDRGEPVTFGLNQVVPCWTEGLQRMKVGGKSQLVCPPQLAYGSQGRPPQIPANAALVFEVELLEITTQ